MSLRPQGQQAALRAAALAMGGRTLALPPWRLQRIAGAAAAAGLQRALQAPAVVFTSPAAVIAAASAPAFGHSPRGPWLAVGAGTLRALRAAGVTHAQAPERMDSEGLLALPALGAVQGRQVGLVTAPGGRGAIAETLQARGAEVLRADVYRRVPVRLSARALSRLAQAPRPWLLAVSSGEALQRTWAQLAPAWQQCWRAHMQVVVASERLQRQAHALGLVSVSVADGPTPAQLLAACAAILDGRQDG